ncbi:MAG: hypothetical protein QXU72_03020 [Thermofilum sp.]
MTFYVNLISVYTAGYLVESGYVTVSAKIPRRLKLLLDKYGVKPGPLIRRALEEEVRRRRLEELEARARRLAEELATISDEEVVSLIRADREGR